MSELARCVILAALMAEAVPMINFYRLQKQKKPHTGIQLFCSDHVDLVVSGMGAKRMQAAILAYIRENPPVNGTRWLNLGTAGALEHAVGELVWARSIAGTRIGQPQGAGMAMSMDVVSLNKPGVNYVQGVLFDMEAQTCIDTLTENVIEFEPAHLFCAKVVSDNRLDSGLKKNKHQVMALMNQHQEPLSKEINKLINQYNTAEC